MSKKPRPASPPGDDDAAALYARIHAVVVAARQTVARGVDLVRVCTNFEIGRHILENEQQGQHRVAYGAALLKMVGEQLTRAFGRGFSRSNLEYMRRFYLLYRPRENTSQFKTGKSVPAGVPSTLPFILSWTHYVFLPAKRLRSEETIEWPEAPSTVQRP